MKLSDLQPKPVNFQALGISLVFRPYTLADDARAVDMFGGDREKYIEALESFAWEKISRIAWFQLDLNSQKKIISQVDGSYYDPDTGEERPAKLTPLQKFQQLFIGITGQIELITNLTRCMGLNIPDLNEPEALKKWVGQLGRIQPTGL